MGVALKESGNPMNIIKHTIDGHRIPPQAEEQVEICSKPFCSEHDNTVKTLDRVNRMLLEYTENHKIYVAQQEDILNRLYHLEQKAGKSVAEETFWGAMDKLIISIKKSPTALFAGKCLWWFLRVFVWLLSMAIVGFVGAGVYLKATGATGKGV